MLSKIPVLLQTNRINISLINLVLYGVNEVLTRSFHTSVFFPVYLVSTISFTHQIQIDLLNIFSYN